MANYGDGSIRYVTLKRSVNGYGFNLAQQFPSHISAIQKGGQAERAGLRLGDRLIAVDDVDVKNVSHMNIAELIFSSKDGLKLTVVGMDSHHSSLKENEPTELAVNSRMRYNSPMKKPYFTNRHYNSADLGLSHETRPRITVKPIKHAVRFHNSAHNEDVETKYRNRAKAIIRSLSEPAHRNIKSIKVPVSKTVSSASEYDSEEKSTMKFVVAYIGAVPVQPACASRQRIVRLALESLQAQRIRIRTVLLEIFNFGVVVTNGKGFVINRFHAEKISFAVAYARNKQFFAIVTVHDSNRAIAQTCMTPDVVADSICHLFAVDSELRLHSFHHYYSTKFRFKCTKEMNVDFCMEFPCVSTPIVQHLNKITLGVSHHMIENLHKTSFRKGYASSNSDSGLGTECHRSASTNCSDGLRNVLDSNSNGIEYIRISSVKGLSQEDLSSSTSLSMDEKWILKRNTKSLRVTFSSAGSSIVETTADVHQECSYENSNYSTKICFNEAAARECVRSTRTPSTNAVEPGAGATSTSAAAAAAAADISTTRGEASSTTASSTDESSLTRRLDSTQFCCKDSVSVDGRRNSGFITKKAQSQQDLTSENVSFNSNDPPNRLLKHCLQSRLQKNNFCTSNSASDIHQLTLDSEQNDDGFDSNLKRRFETNFHFDNTHNHAGSKNSSQKQNSSSLLRRLTRSDTRSSFKMKQAKRERLEAWGSDFDKLLKDPAGLYSFSEFLRKQYSQENINFWVACENFKVCDECQRNKVAMELYERYFASGCTEPVNVDSMVRQTIRENVAAQSFSAIMYNQAQYQIFHLMKYDCYPRFLKSDDYHHCWELVEKGHCLPEMKEPFLKSPESCSTWFSSLGKSSGKEKEKENKDDKKKKLLLPWKPKFTSSKKIKDDSVDQSSPSNEDDSKFLSNLGNKRKQGWRSGKQYSTPNEVMHNAQRANPHLAAVTRTDVPSTSNCPPDVVPQPDPPSTPSPGLSRNCMESGPSTSQSCTVNLPNREQITVLLRGDQTVKQWLQDMSRRYSLNYLATDVIDSESEQIVDLTANSSRALNGKVVRLETSILFRLDIPSSDDSSQRKLIVVKTRSDASASQVLRPILHNYGLKLDTMVITVAGSNEVLPNHSSIAQANNKKLMVLTQDEFQEWVHRDHDSVSPSSTCSNQSQFHISPSQDDSLNQRSFQQLTGHKGLSILELPQDSDTKKPKGGGMLKFVKKSIETKGQDQRSSPTRSMKITHTHQTKTLAAKGPVLTPEELVERSREEKKLVELLSRAQASSFDDQRGPCIRNLELPEFLKEKNSQSVSIDDIILTTQLNRTPSKPSRPTDMVHRKLCPIKSGEKSNNSSGPSSPRDKVGFEPTNKLCFTESSKKHLTFDTSLKPPRKLSDATTPVIKLSESADQTERSSPGKIPPPRGGVKSLGSTPTNPNKGFAQTSQVNVSKTAEKLLSNAVASENTKLLPKNNRSLLQPDVASSSDADYTLKSGDLKQFVEKRRGLYVKDEEWEVDYV